MVISSTYHINQVIKVNIYSNGTNLFICYLIA